MMKCRIVKETDGNGFSKYWVEKQCKKFWLFGKLVWRSVADDYDYEYGDGSFATYEDAKHWVNCIATPVKTTVGEEITVQ